MRAGGVAALIAGLPGLVLALPVSAVCQDAAQLAALDAKIANLENENAALKKRVRLEALSKENAALKKQLGIADNHQSRPNEGPSISRQQRVTASRAEIPDVLAYAMKEPPYPKGTPVAVIDPPPPLPVWRGFYTGASFGVGWLRAQESADATTNSLFSTNASSSSPGFSNNIGSMV
jgi:hypothetical protein